MSVSVSVRLPAPEDGPHQPSVLASAQGLGWSSLSGVSTPQRSAVPSPEVGCGLGPCTGCGKALSPELGLGETSISWSREGLRPAAG